MKDIDIIDRINHSFEKFNYEVDDYDFNDLRNDMYILFDELKTSLNKRYMDKKLIEDIFEDIIASKLLNRPFLHERLDELLKIKHEYINK